jgi:hypothetical protein
MTALAVYERLKGSDSPDAARCLNVMGAVYRLQQRWGEAQAVFTRALGVYGAGVCPDHPATARSLNNLADMLRQLGEL